MKSKKELLHEYIEYVLENNRLAESVKSNKETLIQLVRDADKEVLWYLVYNFGDIGFYREDKRRSAKKWIIDCIENCYHDNVDPNDVSVVRQNKEIENAIFNATHKDKEEYLNKVEDDIDLLEWSEETSEDIEYKKMISTIKKAYPDFKFTNQGYQATKNIYQSALKKINNKSTLSSKKTRGKIIGYTPYNNNNYKAYFEDGSSSILSYNQIKLYLDYQDLNDVDQEEYSLDHLDEADLGYHYGDLGKGTDTSRKNMEGSSRSTGHLGTGTYFLSKPIKDNDFSRKDRPLKTIDFSKYNLYKPKNLSDIDYLYNFLKSLNNHDFEANNIIQKLQPLKDKLDNSSFDYTSPEYKETNDYIYKTLKDNNFNVYDRENYINSSYEYSKAKPGDEGWYRQYLSNLLDEIFENYDHENDRWERNVRNLISYTQIDDSMFNKGNTAVLSNIDKNTEDSLSTIFMKALGYEGIDVRAIPEYDNTSHGSVIYDLKESKKIIESEQLNEYNLQDVINDSKSSDPRRIELSKSLYTEYKGVDSDGTLLFETDSQTRSNLGHKQRIFYEGFFNLLDKVDQNSEITEEDVVDILTGDLMLDCSCESFLYWGWAFKSWRENYGLKKETRKPKRNNVDLHGGCCKHLLSVLDLINHSNTLFDKIASDLNELFSHYKKTDDIEKEIERLKAELANAKAPNLKADDNNENITDTK